jgi:hypothetical protein
LKSFLNAYIIFLVKEKNNYNNMVSGAIQLAAYGEQDVYLTSKPEITFFHAKYSRHTNYSRESIPQYFNLTPNFGNRVTAVLSKNGHMIGSIFLNIVLPAIPSTFNGTPVFVAWRRKIGLALINTAEFEIGGRIIDRHYGDWMNIWFELTRYHDVYKMIGDRPEIYDFTSGKPSYSINVPLLFSFCRQFLPLPIIGMYHSDIKVHIEFNTLTDCLLYGPTFSVGVDKNIVNYNFGEYISQTQGNSTVYMKYMSFNPITQSLNYLKIDNNSNFVITQGTNSMIKGIDTGYSTNVLSAETTYISKSSTLSFLQNLSLNSSCLYVDYYYLEDDEALKFSHVSSEILFEYLQSDTERILYNAANSINLGFIHPTKELFFRTQPQYLILGGLRDYFNYTDGILPTSKSLILQAGLLLNGKDRVSLRPTNYFELLEVFKGHTRSPDPGIMVFSFAFAPEKYQPSGSCNFSRIDDITLQVILSRTVSYSNPAYIRVYGLSYNVLKIENGRTRVVFDL